jgi:hypothetical protein
MDELQKSLPRCSITILHWTVPNILKPPVTIAHTVCLSYLSICYLVCFPVSHLMGHNGIGWPHLPLQVVGVPLATLPVPHYKWLGRLPCKKSSYSIYCSISCCNSSLLECSPAVQEVVGSSPSRGISASGDLIEDGEDLGPWSSLSTVVTLTWFKHADLQVSEIQGVSLVNAIRIKAVKRLLPTYKLGLPVLVRVWWPYACWGSK